MNASISKMQSIPSLPSGLLDNLPVIGVVKPDGSITLPPSVLARLCWPEVETVPEDDDFDDDEFDDDDPRWTLTTRKAVSLES